MSNVVTLLFYYYHLPCVSQSLISYNMINYTIYIYKVSTIGWSLEKGVSGALIREGE